MSDNKKRKSKHKRQASIVSDPASGQVNSYKTMPDKAAYLDFLKQNSGDLAVLRHEIEAIDANILSLFEKRMAVAEAVAANKEKSGKAVYDAMREEQLIVAAADQMPAWHRERVSNLLRGLMRLSRGVQYEYLLSCGRTCPTLEIIEAGSRIWPEHKTIFYQGTEGSYSEKAAKLLFPAQSVRSIQTFEAACHTVWEDETAIAVLPLENSTAGTVDDVYDLLLKYDLYIGQSIALPITHALMTLPGTDRAKIKTVISHPQALAQCSDYIRKQGWQTQESLNTAFAARLVADSGDDSLAAIGSDVAATACGLEVLAEQINNTVHNQTRFIAVSKKPVIQEAADKISLILRLPHQSGALAATLAIFSDRHLNLTKIQSRPDPQLPWAYLFYLDFAAEARDRKQAEAALYQLSQEMPFLRFLGWYKEQTI